MDRYSFFHLEKGNVSSLFKDYTILDSLGHLWGDDGLAGGDHVAGQGEETGAEAGLGQHPEFDLVNTQSLVIPPPVPARDVQQEGLGITSYYSTGIIMDPFNNVVHTSCI